ncbi:glucuronate isomerase [Poriferisphaera sp. WC338]|uniref:glucuronate isomerase n=1 Tax=Poriferisphaera sp. WC338 TaxID=3425129 RepID=UPI003D816B95
MTPFIHDDFMLQNNTACELYHEYAAQMPIIDYHNHLSAADLANNRQYQNLYEIWLEGDHYKWRAMRAAGIEEQLCTGKASPYEKFMAWARAVPQTLGNPLYHWTHLELKRYFGIDELLNERTAEAIWHKANARLADQDRTSWEILNHFNIKVLCTTDDPTDNLSSHIKLAQSACHAKVYPTFRPDRALQLHDASTFNAWTNILEHAADVPIHSLSQFLMALDKQHATFHNAGCRLSDHGLLHCTTASCDEHTATQIFGQARKGHQISDNDQSLFAGFMMQFFGELDAQRGWTKQLHLGAIRNNNTTMHKLIGEDTGFDSIGDYPQAQSLCRYLDELVKKECLPRMILYNLNPADNPVFATMAGNFQDHTTPGKIQWGSAWWFLDQKNGIESQLRTLMNLGLLSTFVGMLTDSRSMMSFTRHEYFRRILCNLLGEDIENGLLPNDVPLIGELVRQVSYHNADRYFNFMSSRH